MEKKLFNKDYLLLLQGNAVSRLGDVLYSVAISYWVYENTGSTALMGITASISMFVIMFFSPFAGSIIDKCNRKWMIVMMDVVRGVLLCLVGVIALRGNLSVPIVIITAFIAAICGVLFSPAVNTVFIDIIPHDDMVRGQSISNTVTSVINLVGDAISGLLVVIFGVPLIILLNGISYLISAFTEIFIDVPTTSQQGQKITISTVLHDMKDGIVGILNNKALRVFMPMAMLVNLLCGGTMDLFMAFVLESGFTLEHYSIFMAAQTAASLITVMSLSIFKFSNKIRYLLFAFGFIGSAIFYLIAYNIRIFYVMLPCLFMAGSLNVFGNSIFNAALALALPINNRGAILGIVSAFSTGGAALSAIIYGLLCELYPTWIVFTIGVILSFIPIIFMCINKGTKQFILEN